MTARRCRGTGARRGGDQLARGRRLVGDLDRTEWELGDLAIEVAGPPPQRGQHDANRQALVTFAEQIGVAPTRLAEYRSMAAAWGERLDGVAWSMHRGLVSRDDRAAHLNAFLTDCHQRGVAPTRDRLRTWPPLAGPDEPGTKRSPRYRYEDRVAEARALIQGMEQHRQDSEDFVLRELTAELRTLPAKKRIEVDDFDGVARCLIDSKAFGDAADTIYLFSIIASDPMNPWERVRFHPEWADPVTVLAGVYSTIFKRWDKRHHPAENDPWED